MRNGKFKVLYETIYNRYKQGAGFLEGDLVKLKDGYKTEETYKSLAETLKQRVEDCAQSGLNLRVGRLHTPYNQYGSFGHLNLPATHADLYQELSPGNFGNLVTVPLSILEPVDTGVNLSPVSKKNKRSASEAPYQKPGKWDSNKDTPETKQQNELGHKQNWIEKGDYKLAIKDTKSSVGANKYNDNKPSNFKPLPKNKILRESDVALALENAYMQVITETTDVDIDDEVNIAKAMDHDDDITSEEKENMSVAAPDLTEKDMKIEEYMIKPDCWNKEEGTVAEKCWNEDGSMKDDCWQDEEISEDVAPGQAAGGVLQNPVERDNTEGPLESKNHLGEREFQTYEAWKRACKQIKPDAKFTGDKDIDSCEVGEWDGAIGTIFNTKNMNERQLVNMSFDDFLYEYGEEMREIAKRYEDDQDMDELESKIQAVEDITEREGINIPDF